MEYKNKLEFYTGYFSGRSFVGKGVGKDKDGNKRNWILYNLVLKPKLDSQYGTKFKVFTPCKGWELLDELEGEPMTIGFIRGTYVHKEFGLCESRTVKYISAGKKENVTQYVSQFSKKKKKNDVVSDDIQVNVTKDQKKVLDAYKKGLLKLDDEVTVGTDKIKVDVYLAGLI